MSRGKKSLAAVGMVACLWLSGMVILAVAAADGKVASRAAALAAMPHQGKSLEPATRASGLRLVLQKAAPDGGQRLFARNCGRCHGLKGSGGFGPDLRGLTLSDEQIKKTILGGKGDMPGFGGHLREEEIRQFIAYLRSLKK